MFYTRCYVALIVMFKNKPNILNKDDVDVIMNMFDSIETIRYIGDNKYQVHLNIEDYSTTLVVLINEKVITNISLLNCHNAT
jgi:hypothetical protein